jgi:hypothetical protein
MWIRTQDKRRMKDVDDCGLSKNGLQIFSYNPSGKYNFSLLLGEYETEKRSLEILDDIQERLLGKNLVPTQTDVKIKGMRGCYNDYHDPLELNYLPTVYEMPLA